MNRDMKQILRNTANDLVEIAGQVKVLVALHESSPDEKCLAGLKALGLTIDKVVGNKVIGSINGAALSALGKARSVAEVETSTRLGPH